ncbi:hypothetical protein VR611_11935 [Aquirufa nivalisilvae]
MKAKTYKSNNNFTAPESLSDFGIEISNANKRKYLGLEEFNFCPILLDFKFENQHVAYIPCFSSNLRPPINRLKLFYRERPGVTIHYATLINVSQIEQDKSLIQNLRKSLEIAGFPSYVENSLEFQRNYVSLFEPAFATWKQNFESDTIIAKRTVNRFIVNAFFESIEFHDSDNIVNWSNLKRASVLFS